MDKYACPCGFVYDPAVGDPDHGVKPGTAFADLPAEWVCPVCGCGVSPWLNRCLCRSLWPRDYELEYPWPATPISPRPWEITCKTGDAR